MFVIEAQVSVIWTVPISQMQWMDITHEKISLCICWCSIELDTCMLRFKLVHKYHLTLYLLRVRFSTVMLN